MIGQVLMACSSQVGPSATTLIKLATTGQVRPVGEGLRSSDHRHPGVELPMVWVGFGSVSESGHCRHGRIKATMRQPLHT